MRRTRLERKTPLRSAGRVKARNATRRAKNWARAYGSPERVQFIASLPCCVCATIPSQNAHVGRNHMQYKADASSIVPLCAACHARLHRLGRETFETYHGVNLAMYAAETDALARRMGVA